LKVLDVGDLGADGVGWDDEASRHGRVADALTGHLTRLER
jgi:hypothetical protein